MKKARPPYNAVIKILTPETAINLVKKTILSLYDINLNNHDPFTKKKFHLKKPLKL